MDVRLAVADIAVVPVLHIVDHSLALPGIATVAPMPASAQVPASVLLGMAALAVAVGVIQSSIRCIRCRTCRCILLKIRQKRI